MKVRIIIGLKKKILDPQGRAVQNALDTLGYKDVMDVRVGKHIEMEVAPQEQEALRAQVREMCDKLLTNPVIEDYQIEIDRS